MDRTQRAEALACITPEDATRLAERVSDGSLGELSIIAPPTVGMIMARATDGARGDIFNLGEVLVTEARVSVSGVEGWGMVVGNQPDHALAMAVIDASLEAGHPARAAVERTLTALADRSAARHSEELQRVAPTRVEFETF